MLSWNKWLLVVAALVVALNQKYASNMSVCNGYAGRETKHGMFY